MFLFLALLLLFQVLNSTTPLNLTRNNDSSSDELIIIGSYSKFILSNLTNLLENSSVSDETPAKLGMFQSLFIIWYSLFLLVEPVKPEEPPKAEKSI